ncbi:MAG: DUF6516 family protein [Proteobacteria bacterium]|jgi:hypothetical protein|nr:DUF6516 family protein [Pseudomonadota bacterium]
MKTQLVFHQKVTNEKGGTVEVKIWELPQTSKDKPHGYRYSLVYILNGTRIIGYDNGERKGDHRHYGNREEPYRFISIERLFEDFYRDIRRCSR